MGLNMQLIKTLIKKIQFKINSIKKIINGFSQKHANKRNV